MALNRREFIRRLALGGTGMAFFGCSIMRGGEVAVEGEKETTVVLVRDKRLTGAAGGERVRIIRAMLDAAVARAVGTETARDAWRSLFSEQDVVGIKVNAIAGRNLSSHPELVACIVESLKSAGIPPERVIIWDRRCDELERAGFRINRSGRGVRCYGTDAEGVGYARELIVQGSVATRLSRILYSRCTSLINVPVLKDHNIAGVTLSMKNYYGAINNPNKFHGNNCDPYIADLNAIPLIRDKTRLIICDAIVAQYDRGPGYVPKYSVMFNGLLVGRDPVALDRIGAEIIEGMRARAGLPSLAEAGRPPRYISTAADPQHRLGVDDPSRIEFVRIDRG